MIRKILAMLLAACMLLGVTGCAVVGDIAGSVADAAVKELENQLKATLEKHKVEVVEVKTAFGQLNGEDEKALQFFCAALIKCDSDTAAQTCATALDTIFEETGWMSQSASQVTHSALVHKTVKFDHTDFSSGNYYTVYVYNSALAIDLPLKTH